jgi:hypothetical protein
MTITARIQGYVVGPIWWPAGAECFKEFNYDVTREEGRSREHCLAITRDGDFQSCSIAQGELVVTRHSDGHRVTRSWPLRKFPSVADMLHEDPDWFPSYDEEDED